MGGVIVHAWCDGWMRTSILAVLKISPSRPRLPSVLARCVLSRDMRSSIFYPDEQVNIQYPAYICISRLTSLLASSYGREVEGVSASPSSLSEDIDMRNIESLGVKVGSPLI